VKLGKISKYLRNPLMTLTLLVLSFLSINAYGVPTSLNINSGSITISATGASGGGLAKSETNLNPDGYTIAGNGIITGNTITVGTNTKVAISLVNVYVCTPYAGMSAFTINGTSNVLLNLSSGSTNTLQGGVFYPGIDVETNASLTIDGSGSLNAYGGNRGTSGGEGQGAGIGGGMNSGHTGNITINGGIVTATGWGDYPGIGMNSYSPGVLTINGGTIKATGGNSNPGLGNGSNSTGNIIINGGDITAIGGSNSAGINCSTKSIIFILGGTVNATGNNNGSGIGDNGSGAGCGDINISGGTITATSGNGGKGSGIGGCTAVTQGSGKISITGGIVNAYGTGSCPGIANNGSYSNYNISSDVTINAFSVSGAPIINPSNVATGSVKIFLLSFLSSSKHNVNIYKDDAYNTSMTIPSSYKYAAKLVTGGSGVYTIMDSDENLYYSESGNGNIYFNQNTNGVLTFNNLAIDRTIPNVISYKSSVDGTHYDGEDLSFIINFNKNVYLKGTLQLALNIGNRTVLANYESGSGTSTLVFDYTIKNTDYDDNGISIGSLSLDNGSLKDLTNNDAILIIQGLVTQTGIIIANSSKPTITVSGLSDGVNSFSDKNEYSSEPNVMNITYTNSTASSSNDLKVYLCGDDADKFSVGFIVEDDTKTDGNPNFNAESRFALMSNKGLPAGIYEAKVILVANNTNVLTYDLKQIVKSQPIVFTEADHNIPNGRINTDYNNFYFSPTGGTENMKYEVTEGSLPDGISITDDGSLMGTPTKAGEFTFNVKVTDSTGQSVEDNFTLTILSADAFVFKIGNTAINTANGITASAKITPSDAGRNGFLIFKLMKDTTPVDIITIKDNITSPKDYEAQFMGYEGSSYKVEVMVWSQLDSSDGNVGTSLAEPVIITP
jgi:hypothetical protein